MGAERWDEQVGSVADEAARLLESLRRTAADPSGPEGAERGPRVHEDDDGHRPAGEDPRPGCDDPFCQWCPLCRTSAVVRSLSPETLARLADLAGVAAAVLTDLASARGRAAQSPTEDPEVPHHPPRPRSQPITVSDADDAEEGPRG